MDRRIFTLALGTFAIGTDGFVIAGVLERLADDMGVSLGQAGLLVSVFATVYALSAPILGILCARVERRVLLTTTMAIFAGANILASCAESYEVLVVSRVLAALSAAAYSPAAVGAAVTTLPPSMRGRAASIVFGGLAVSVATAVPLGTYIAHAASWRMTFGLVALAAVLSGVGIRAVLPTLGGAPGTLTLAQRLSPLRRLPSTLALSGAFLWSTGAFIFYTFIALLVTTATGWPASGLGSILLLYGVGALLGNHLGGLSTDGRLGAVGTLLFALTTITAAFLLLAAAVWAGPPLGTVAAPVAIVILAVAGWSCTPAQAHRVVTLAPASTTEILGLNTMANYLGIGSGAALGAWLAETASPVALPLVAAALHILGIVSVKAVEVSTHPLKVESEATTAEVPLS